MDCVRLRSASLEVGGKTKSTNQLNQIVEGLRGKGKEEVKKVERAGGPRSEIRVRRSEVEGREHRA